jgi:TPR repeat protein
VRKAQTLIPQTRTHWVGVFLICFALPAFSADLDLSQGLEAFSNITPKQANALVVKADEEGDPRLLDYAGWVMAKGLGLEANLLQAGKYFSRAGVKGNDLGWMHLIALSENQDFVDQVKRAADRTDAEAQNLLGELYAHGWGVKTDYLQARSYYQKSAAQGYAPGVRNLGMVYELGWGVKRNYPKAVEYYEKAAEKNDAAAVQALGKAYQEGWGVKKNPQQALTQYKKAAELGTLDAQNDLGWLHQHGLGVAKDMGKARRYYEIAAVQGNANASNNLGYIYHKGLGVTKDEQEALKWYLRGINCGNVDSSNSTDRLQLEGDLDPTEVIKKKKVIHFALNRAELTPEGMKNLATLAEYLAWLGDVKVKVDGYCDARGTEDYNKKLSEKRAATIKEALLYHGVAESMIETKGHGAEKPVAPNDNEDNMSRNRRAEIKVKGL